MQLKNQNIIRVLFLFLYFVFAVILVYFVQPSYIISILVVLGPPSLINFLWLKKSKLKIMVFSLAATALFAPPVELMARLANAWDVASIFPRPLGYIPFENILFAFLNFFWVLSFYEYFIDRDTDKKVSKRFKTLIGFYVFFAVLVFSLFFYKQSIIRLNYYMLSVPVLVLPCLFIFLRYPKLLKKTLMPTIFFALVFFVFEMISMSIGHWWWPGSYLYSFNIQGMVFPLDDVIIWYLLSTPTIIGGYEFFIDDTS